MKLTLRQQLTQFIDVLQNQLFPVVEETIGELDDTARQLVAVLEMIPLARFVPCSGGCVGRPAKDRLAIASAFVAKAVYGFSLTRQLIDRLPIHHRRSFRVPISPQTTVSGHSPNG
jgi:hypothetical protein